MSQFTIEPPGGSSSRAHVMTGAPSSGRNSASSHVVTRGEAPPEALELLQSRLPKLKGLKVSSGAVDPRL